jgi:hypothetical protein
MRLHLADDVREHLGRNGNVGPLFNMTHAARMDMAASVTSARVGNPECATLSSTCVAQMTGR